MAIELYSVFYQKNQPDATCKRKNRAYIVHLST